MPEPEVPERAMPTILRLLGQDLGTFEGWDDWDAEGRLFHKVKASSLFRRWCPDLPPDGFSLAFDPGEAQFQIFAEGSTAPDFVAQIEWRLK